MDEVVLSKEQKTLTIYSHIFIYGKLATEEWATKIAWDIAREWNEPKGTFTLHGEKYQVVFETTGQVLPPDEILSISYNKSYRNKYFHLAEQNAKHISFVDGIKSNTGEFLIRNIKTEHSKTPAHEMGHCWGLWHPRNTDHRGKGQPHIMFPRGTLVDPEFRYKPEAEAYMKDGTLVLEEGCTVHTDKRKVLQQNIDDLQLDQLSFTPEGTSNLCKLSNQIHLDQ